MKSKASWLVALAFIAGLCAGVRGAAGGQQASPRPHWEYMLDGSGKPKKWNAIGEQGWELVNCVGFRHPFNL
jgi:hypothetical protein